jgi:NADPH:quinone reductase-like Zn-dependent oxidoreductase
MPGVRAVVVDPEAPGHLKLDVVEAPQPAPNEALVRVKAISLNRGETRGAQTAAAGSRPGWDFAGLLERPAADGSGPRTGSGMTGRVVGVLRTGAWAELVAVPVANLATIRDNVTFVQASTLPVAGLTALYALDRANGLIGRKVLITGASGGVGNLAIQIAKAAGATVTALVRQEAHAASAKEAGADNVVADETGEAARPYGPFNHILESVGGEVMSNVVTMLAPFGMVVTYGASAGGPASFDSSAIYRSRATITGLGVFVEMQRDGAGAGLTRLAEMVATGTLKPHIAVQAPWSEIGSVAEQLLDRAYPGKAVLTVG